MGTISIHHKGECFAANPLQIQNYILECKRIECEKQWALSSICRDMTLEIQFTW